MELFWEMPVAVCLGRFELVGQIVRWISRQVVLVTTKNVLSPKHILFILIYIYAQVIKSVLFLVVKIHWVEM